MKVTKELLKKIISEEVKNLEEKEHGKSLEIPDIEDLMVEPTEAPTDEQDPEAQDGEGFMKAADWRGETMDTLRSLGLSKEPRLVSMLTKPQVYDFFKSLNDLHKKIENEPARIGRLYDFLLSMSGADLGSETFNQALSKMRSQRGITQKYMADEEK